MTAIAAVILFAVILTIMAGFAIYDYVTCGGTGCPHGVTTTYDFR